MCDERVIGSPIPRNGIVFEIGLARRITRDHNCAVVDPLVCWNEGIEGAVLGCLNDLLGSAGPITVPDLDRCSANITNGRGLERPNAAGHHVLREIVLVLEFAADASTAGVILHIELAPDARSAPRTVAGRNIDLHELRCRPLAGFDPIALVIAAVDDRGELANAAWETPAGLGRVEEETDGAGRVRHVELSPHSAPAPAAVARRELLSVNDGFSDFACFDPIPPVVAPINDRRPFTESVARASSVPGRLKEQFLPERPG